MSESSKIWSFGFLGIFFLFFMQLSTLLIEAIYSVNLLGSSLNLYAAGIIWMLGSGLLVFIPLKIRIAQKSSKNPSSFMYRLGVYFFGPEFTKPLVYRKTSQVLGIIVILSRLIVPFLKTRPIIIVAGLGVTAFLMFYPLYLLQLDRESSVEHGYMQALSFAMATLLSILFRAFGASRDISAIGWTQSIGWVFSAFCLVVLLDFSKLIPLNSTQESPKPPKEIPVSKKSKRKVFFASFGILNLFILVIFGFESPTVFARWTEGNYSAINIIIALSIAVVVLFLVLKPAIVDKLPSWSLWVWNLVFTCLIVLTLLAHTIQFPPNPGSSVVVVTSPMWYQQIPLYLMIVSCPILFLDMMLITSHLIRSSPTLSSLSGGFTLAGFSFMVLIFMAIFTNVWGYVKPISNLFRNLYWLPYLIIGLFITFVAIGVKLKDHPIGKIQLGKASKLTITIISSLCLIGIMVGAIFIVPHPIQTEGTPVTSITVMTYNIQQGNNDTGNKNYEMQLEVIRNSGADIIALQECDTARIGLGNNDVVRYLATELNYYSYYGPKTLTGTYGTAILSKYPIVHSEAIFSYSNKDETGTAYATIEIDGEEFHVFSSHPDGNDDNHRDHMQAIVDKVTDESLTHVISMGDFNTRPFSEWYNISTTILNDAWLTIYPTGIDGFGNNMTRRIDHIFLSPEFTVDNVWVIPEGPSQSDHNVFWATISW